jgi:enoyl-CoA hydratase/carnithine racemase
MDLDEIAYDKADGVAEIALDRPAQRNPISARPGGTRDQILWALADAEDDPDIGCVLLRGEGAAFSSGGDLTGNTPRETAYEHQEFFERAVASCDLVIASEDTRFGLPEGRIGLVGAGPLVPIIGRQWAKFLILTGELIDAARAREIGLVFAVEPADELLERSRDLARRVTRLPREAAILNKRTVDAVADAAGDAAGRIAGAAHAIVTLSHSARATAPDGRTFREIIDTEGVEGMKNARAAQYDTPWLR